MSYDQIVKKINTLLKKELEKRQRNNPAYSLRAFATFLEISPAALSQMISGKRGVSSKRFEQVIERLGLPMTELRPLIKSDKVRGESVLKDDEFKLISEWYHFAILSLGELKSCRADSRWIARRLNIPMGTANEALVRLERMGIIAIKDGRFKQTTLPLTTTTDVPSGTIRQYHKSILGLAQNKIESTPVELREFSALTMAINTKNILKAKKLVKEFKEDMLELLETGTKDEVYQLGIQLFPLTIKDNE